MQVECLLLLKNVLAKLKGNNALAIIVVTLQEQDIQIPTTGIKITGGNIDVSAKLYGMCFRK